MNYIAIPEATNKRLQIWATQAHLSQDEYALQVLENFLDEQEAYSIALAQAERIDQGLDKTLSFDETLKDLGLERHDLS